MKCPKCGSEEICWNCDHWRLHEIHGIITNPHSTRPAKLRDFLKTGFCMVQPCQRNEMPKRTKSTDRCKFGQYYCMCENGEKRCSKCGLKLSRHFTLPNEPRQYRPCSCGHEEKVKEEEDEQEDPLAYDKDRDAQDQADSNWQDDSEGRR